MRLTGICCTATDHQAHNRSLLPRLPSFVLPFFFPHPPDRTLFSLSLPSFSPPLFPDFFLRSSLPSTFPPLSPFYHPSPPPTLLHLERILIISRRGKIYRPTFRACRSGVTYTLLLRQATCMGARASHSSRLGGRETEWRYEDSGRRKESLRGVFREKGFYTFLVYESGRKTRRDKRSRSTLLLIPSSSPAFSPFSPDEKKKSTAKVSRFQLARKPFLPPRQEIRLSVNIVAPDVGIISIWIRDKTRSRIVAEDVIKEQPRQGVSECKKSINRK